MARRLSEGVCGLGVFKYHGRVVYAVDVSDLVVERKRLVRLIFLADVAPRDVFSCLKFSA